MSTPLPFYQSRDAAVRQSFFDAAAAAAASTATGSSSPSAPPRPLPPPPPGQSGRQQQSTGGNSSGGRTDNSHRTNSTTPRDKGPSNNISATAGETGKSAADGTHDTAALLQLHLQLSQHLQRGQQMLLDADIVRALKRLTLKNTNSSGAPDPPPPPPCGGKTEQPSQLRGKSSGSNYSSSTSGHHGQSYGRGSNDRSTPASLRKTNSSRGSVVGTSTASLGQGGTPPSPTLAGNNPPGIRDRASLSGPNCDGAGYGTNPCSLDSMAQPPVPPGSQQSRSVQNSASGRTASRGKQHQHSPQSWRCRVCDAFNVGQPTGRCSCCGKVQQPARHSSSNNGAGRRSQHGQKQAPQQGSMQQQNNLQLQQLQRDVLLAAVSAAAAAAEKRADDNKVKRAAAAAAAAIAAESQQHGSGRKHGSSSQCGSYFTQNNNENLGASQNVGKQIFEGVSGLNAASGGALTPESDSSFELFLTENFLRQQHHGHMGSGRLLTEDGYEDSTTAASAAAAAAATLFPGLLQSLEKCSPTPTLLTKTLPSSALHEGSGERAQQPQLARGGSDTTNGAASTSHTTPLGLSSELLEGFTSLDREEMGRMAANCLTGGSSSASASMCNVDSSGSRGPVPTDSLTTAENGLNVCCNTVADASGGPGPAQESPPFSGDILLTAYNPPATDACLRGNNSRSRPVGACGSYQGRGESVLSSAPGLAIGKGSTTLPGLAGEECGTTPFSAATLLSEAETPFDGNGSTAGMNIMGFQGFTSAPRSTLFGDVLSPGAGSLNLLGDCRSRSSGTPSPLTRGESNTMCSGGGRVVRSVHQYRSGGSCEMINAARVEGGDSSTLDRSMDQNAVGVANALLASMTDDDGTASHRDAGIPNCAGGRISRGGKRLVDVYSSGERSHQNGIRVESVLMGRSNRGGGSSNSHQVNMCLRTPGQHPQQSNTGAHEAGAATAPMPFHHNSLQQLLLQGAGGSGDSPQGGDASDFSVTRSSLPLSSAASSPSAGVGAAEEYSPLAVNGGGIGGPMSASFGGFSGNGGLNVDPASLRALLPTFLSPVQMLLLEAKEVADRLVEEFTALGYEDPTSKAADALRTSLSALGYSATPTSASHSDQAAGSGGRAGSDKIANGDISKAGTGTSAGIHNSKSDGDATGCVGEETSRNSKNANWVQGVGGPHFSAPAMLAHPDEFKNPSSFLKIYGDPMCAVAEANSSSPQAGLFVLGARGAPRSGPGGSTGRYGEGFSGGNNLPIKGHNGNWVCDTCSNINFPRRFRCNKCGGIRGPQGDAIVAEYAKLVYHQHLKTYRNLASRPGVDLPLKRLQGSAGGGIAGNGGCGGGVGNGGAKKICNSSYCSPSSNGGSTTTNSITGSTPSTPSETANIAAVRGGTVSTGGLHGINGAANCHRIADGVHAVGSEGGRAHNGPRVPAGIHSIGGAGNPVSHPNQNAKGQPSPETPSFPRNTRSLARRNTGSSVNSFPPPPSTQGAAAPAPPRYQPDIACDHSTTTRGITHYVGSSPRASRGSTTKNNGIGHGSMSGMLADSSPQGYKRTGNCSSRERQRGPGTASNTRSTSKVTQATYGNDSAAKPGLSVYSPNCSPTNCRPGGTNANEKDCGSVGVDTEEASTGLAGKACDNGKASPCCTQSPRNDEVDKGDSVAPASPVSPLPTKSCVNSADEKTETLPTLACEKKTEGSGSDSK